MDKTLYFQSVYHRYLSASLSLLYLNSLLPSVFATYFSINSIFSKMICLGKSFSFSINFLVSMIKKQYYNSKQYAVSRKLLTQKVNFSLTCLVLVLPRDFLIPLCCSWPLKCLIRLNLHTRLECVTRLRPGYWIYPPLL